MTNPSLSLAIAPLEKAGEKNFAIWVLKAPYPGGYVHHDCIWSESLTQSWLAWQEMFCLRGLPHVPFIHHASPAPSLPADDRGNPSAPAIGQSVRLMQNLGIELWAWLFEGSIQNSLAQSQGIAFGQEKPLRLRLDIRAPDLIPLPWEIMQSQAGKQAIALGQQVLFSRTTSDVDPLKPTRQSQALRILLVLGQDAENPGRPAAKLQLEQEAEALATVLKRSGQSQLRGDKFLVSVPAFVDILVQPTPAELIKVLDKGTYNIFFYAGHGVPAPDGGLLFLRPDAKINGTELAQVLVRNQVTLAVFNACWGAQPDSYNQRAIPRSSLAEVLLHHGVPAVLAMRDSIADQEALAFIQSFSQALAARMPIDQAVAVARQQMLTLFKFNQPAWTLPVLYMHPEFEGELIKPIEEGITELPGIPGWKEPTVVARLRSLETNEVWKIRGGLMRVGRQTQNDLPIREQWVSQEHAEIIYRDSLGNGSPSAYFLRDFSRYGTFILSERDWQKVHHQEVPLPSGVQLKFGSSYGQTFEFVIESTG